MNENPAVARIKAHFNNPLELVWLGVIDGVMRHLQKFF